MQIYSDTRWKYFLSNAKIFAFDMTFIREKWEERRCGEDLKCQSLTDPSAIAIAYLFMAKSLSIDAVMGELRLLASPRRKFSRACESLSNLGPWLAERYPEVPSLELKFPNRVRDQRLAPNTVWTAYSLCHGSAMVDLQYFKREWGRGDGKWG